MEPDRRLAPLRAMIRPLSPQAVEALARQLHRQLNAPPGAAKRRKRELGLLARLIDERRSPDGRPYVERKLYEARRAAENADAPRAALLVDRYGSWRRACYAAWALLPDGRTRVGAQRPPWPMTKPGQAKAATYTADECATSIQQCAHALGDRPSSYEYTRWMDGEKQKAKAAGRTIRVAPVQAILRELAPNRGRRDGWQIAIERALMPNRTE